MRVAPRFVLLVIGLLVLAILSLWPRGNERLAMLADEGRHKEVIAQIESQLAKAPRTPDLLAALARSYAAVGEYHRTIDVLDAYLAMRPDDLAARERQAELLLQTGPIDRYLDALARLVAAQPSPSGVRRLIELYRLHGRADDELATLRAYADHAMLDPTQLERLGAILAERAEWGEARRWLELADQNAPPHASAGRLLLLDVLIQSNEIDQAYRRAQVWMTAWRSSFLSGKLILRMAQSGLSVPASELALEFAKVMPEHVFELAGLLARKGRQELAHQMLAEWVDRATNPTRQQLRALVHASVLAGDIHGPVLRLAQMIRSGADPAVSALLAEELAHSFGKSVLASIRPLLSNEALLARPLFAAELALFEGNREMARWFLSRADLSELSPEQTATWLALLRSLEPDAVVFNRLAALWHDERLPADLVPAFAHSALQLGRVRMHDQIWSSMGQ